MCARENNFRPQRPFRDQTTVSTTTSHDSIDNIYFQQYHVLSRFLWSLVGATHEQSACRVLLETVRGLDLPIEGRGVKSSISLPSRCAVETTDPPLLFSALSSAEVATESEPQDV